MSSTGFSVPRAAVAALALFSASASLAAAAPSFVDPSVVPVDGGVVPEVAAVRGFLPEGVSVGFEPGLTREQQSRLLGMVPEIMEAQALSSVEGVARRSTCAAKTACYIATCPIPFLGISCLACDAIKCRREAEPVNVDVVAQPPQEAVTLTLPENLGFEPGLTREQAATLYTMLPEIMEAQSAHHSEGVARRSTCAAKTACYIATCPIPILGISCLACDAIKCRRDAEPSQTVSLTLPEDLGFEPGLTSAQQQALVAIMPEIMAAKQQGAHHESAESGVSGQVARRGTCAAKTACYIATCPFGLLGLSCLACAAIC